MKSLRVVFYPKTYLTLEIIFKTICMYNLVSSIRLSKNMANDLSLPTKNEKKKNLVQGFARHK